MNARTLAVFLKELLDSARDRRSFGTAILYALLGPLMLIPMLSFASHTWDRGSAKLVQIPAEGVERAPGLVEYLRQRSIELVAPPSDPAQAVRDLKCDVVLVIPPSYPDEFRAGRPAPVRIVTDHSRSTAAGEIHRLDSALESYSRTVGALRLVARGVSPRVVSAIAVEVDDVATPESEGAMLLAIVPMFLMMSLFVGGVYIAVDVTAGERERGSLEPLMATPLSTTEIVMGKLWAVCVFSLCTMTVTLVAFGLVINLAPFPEVPGMKFKLGVDGSLAIFAALFPLVLPVAALQMLVAARSKTSKEAFTATSLCNFIPMATGLFLTLSPFRSTLASMATPVFGQNLLVNEVLRGDPLAVRDFVVAAATSTIAGLLLAALAVVRCANSRMLAD
ncbi:MAG TPA: ABC transporter permease [Polyangiaceae bacterium]